MSINYVLGILLILTTILEIGITVSVFFLDEETESRKTSNLPKGTLWIQIFLNPNLSGFKAQGLSSKPPAYLIQFDFFKCVDLVWFSQALYKAHRET